MISECATPGCTHTSGQGWTRCFCRRCATRLAEIRTDFEAEEPTAASTLGKTLSGAR